MAGKATHCTVRISANTRPHQLHWSGRLGLSSHAYLHMYAGSLHNAATMLLLKIEGDAVLSAYNEHVES